MHQERANMGQERADIGCYRADLVRRGLIYRLERTDIS